MNEKAEWWRIANAMIRHHSHIDPDSLTDEEWAMHFNDLLFIRAKESENNK